MNEMASRKVAEHLGRKLTMVLPIQAVYKILNLQMHIHLVKRLTFVGEKLRYFSVCFLSKLDLLCSYFLMFLSHLRRLLVHRTKPIWISLFYFVSASFVGFLLLKSLRPNHEINGPKDLDLFFMSTSAATVSSMSTVEMEALSSSQLIVFALLMLTGSEVFTSLLDLQLLKLEMKRKKMRIGKITMAANLNSSMIQTTNLDNQTEQTLIAIPEMGYIKTSPPFVSDEVMNNSVWFLSFIISGYLLVSHVIGSISIFAYLSLVPSAREAMRNKGFEMLPFSIFMAISSFANGGFAPFNENMIPFKKNCGILSMIIALVLMGNTLYPPFLQLTMWALNSFYRSEEVDCLSRHSERIGFHHLRSKSHSLALAVTALGFIATGTILFCFMEWNTEVVDGLNPYQKIMVALFQSVNARHAGETLVDLSVISPAVLVFYVIMMYLPPYTSFMPTRDKKCTSRIVIEDKPSKGLVRSLIMSQLSYLAISVILICITERRKLSEDPLNFNVFNIVVEVISAYGNVGFSVGYSCARQLKHDKNCKDVWYGFVGKWSSQGKLVLIFVMFFGRLKKFSMGGGKAWKLG